MKRVFTALSQLGRLVATTCAFGIPKFIAAWAMIGVLLFPSTSFANNCGGVCTEDEADDVYICFYFLVDPCDWYDHWVNK